MGWTGRATVIVTRSEAKPELSASRKTANKVTIPVPLICTVICHVPSAAVVTLPNDNPAPVFRISICVPGGALPLTTIGPGDTTSPAAGDSITGGIRGVAV